MEAFEAVAAAEFPLELDLRQLSDGTLVPQHDPVVDRTLVGMTGAIEEITPQQWAAANIVHPTGGQPGTPTTWTEVLDTFGGKQLLVPELKGSANVDEFIASITSRGLQDTVIAQSFSYDACMKMADAGLTVLYLLSEHETPYVRKIQEDGITHIGPPATVDGEYLRELTETDLIIWPYTVNTIEQAESLLDQGVDGMFTDDPWTLAEAIQ